MKRTISILTILLLSLMFLPASFAIEGNDKLLESTVSIGASTTFADQLSKQRELRVESVNTQKDECVIRLDALMKTLRENEEVIIDNLRIRLNSAEESGCEIVVKPVDDEKVHVTVTSKPLNIKPDANGYYFVEDGAKVDFEFIIHNPTNKVIEGSGGQPGSTKKGPDYIFYNNGYPTGKGSTSMAAGYDLTLYPGDNKFGAYNVPFYYKDDTLYNSGSFITVVVVHGEGVYPTYAGQSIYVKKPSVPDPSSSNYIAVSFSNPPFPALSLSNPPFPGCCYVKEGQTLHLQATVSNPTSKYFKGLPYIFYNNDDDTYTGKGATKKLKGTVDLPPYGKSTINLDMDFYIKDDILLNDGHFDPFIILDPEHTQIDYQSTATFDVNIPSQQPSGGDVMEQVKCVFVDATQQHECYSPKGSCSGVGTCIVDVKGYLGEQVTWKSSCGGYAYTTIDGQSDYAMFKCGPEPTNPNPCLEKGEIFIKLGGEYTFAIAPESVNIQFIDIIKKDENYGNVFTLQSNLVSHPTTTPPMPKGSSYSYEMSSGQLSITVLGGSASFVPSDYVKPDQGMVQLLLTYQPKSCGYEPPEPTHPDCRAVYQRCVDEGGSEDNCRRLMYTCLPSLPSKNPACADFDEACKGLNADNCIAICVKNGGEPSYCKKLYYECQGETGFVDRPTGRLPETYCGDGCYANSDIGKCVPYGTRLSVKGEPSYCSVDGQISMQRRDGESAENNYECVSNSARYGVCENVAEQTGIMQKIFGWLARLFGSESTQAEKPLRVEPSVVEVEAAEVPVPPTIRTEPIQVTSFEECIDAGYPMLKSMPPQCKTPDGRRFVVDVS